MPATYSLPANLLSTFDIGFFPADSAIHHEDLTDVITIIDSFQTPFFSGAPKIRARDVVHSWPIDTLLVASAMTSGGSPDGVDFSGDALTTPQRLFNSTQIFRRDVIVSDRERQANPAGIRDMYEHQIMKEFKNIARNCEWTIFRNNSTASATGLETSAVSAAPLMAGLRGIFGPAAGTTTITTASASAATGFTTGDMVALAQTMFTNGAEPDSLWLSPSTKLQFINATLGSAINVRNIAATDQRLVANIDVFESPFNQLFAVITDRFIPMGTASASGYAYFLGDRSLAKLAFYRPPQHKEMGKQGDNTRGLVLMELTLEMTHPSGWGSFSNVTGASGLTT
jgi:hypothetical protein